MIEHTYYLPAYFHKKNGKPNPKILGTHANDREITLLLVSTYFHFLDKNKAEVEKYDGISLYKNEAGLYRLYISLGCKGKGFGSAGYVIDGKFCIPPPPKPGEELIIPFQQQMPRFLNEK